jgi:inorganic triphosphatase YgiF
MGREVELKLEVPASAIDEVARLPWLSEVASGPAKHEKLVTVYFDTAKSKLRKHGLALRVRHSGANRLQTIRAVQKAPAVRLARTNGKKELPVVSPI